MSQKITLQGTPCYGVERLPARGEPLRDFRLTTADPGDAHLSSYSGKYKNFNIFPSLDTPPCAMSVQRFNSAVEALDNMVLLQVSADLPFAQSRFCSAKELNNGVTLSMMRDKTFARDYGVLIEDGPMAGLCARAVVVADDNDIVQHSELVYELADEPDYEGALAALLD